MKTSDPIKESAQNPPDYQAENLACVNHTPAARLNPGMTCPRCQLGSLDYNGLLELACSRCGVLESGVFT